MKADLRSAVISMCEKLKSSTYASTDEINALTKQLKKTTNDSVDDNDHELFMEFYALVADHQKNWLTSGLRYVSKSELTDNRLLLMKLCRELLAVLDVNHAAKSHDDFGFYANSLVGNLDKTLMLIEQCEWEDKFDKTVILHEVQSIYEKLKQEGWRCEEGVALGLVPKDANDFERKYQLFLRALRIQRPIDNMQLIVNKLEKLQLQMKQTVHEHELVTYKVSQHVFFSPDKRPTKVTPSPKSAKKRLTT